MTYAEATCRCRTRPAIEERSLPTWTARSGWTRDFAAMAVQRDADAPT